MQIAHVGPPEGGEIGVGVTDRQSRAVDEADVVTERDETAPEGGVLGHRAPHRGEAAAPVVGGGVDRKDLAVGGGERR